MERLQELTNLLTSVCPPDKVAEMEAIVQYPGGERLLDPLLTEAKLGHCPRVVTTPQARPPSDEVPPHIQQIASQIGRSQSQSKYRGPSITPIGPAGLSRLIPLPPRRYPKVDVNAPSIPETTRSASLQRYPGLDVSTSTTPEVSGSSASSQRYPQLDINMLPIPEAPGLPGVHVLPARIKGVPTATEYQLALRVDFEGSRLTRLSLPGESEIDIPQNEEHYLIDFTWRDSNQQTLVSLELALYPQYRMLALTYLGNMVTQHERMAKLGQHYDFHVHYVPAHVPSGQNALFKGAGAAVLSYILTMLTQPGPCNPLTADEIKDVGHWYVGLAIHPEGEIIPEMADLSSYYEKIGLSRIRPGTEAYRFFESICNSPDESFTHAGQVKDIIAKVPITPQQYRILRTMMCQPL